MACEHIEAEGFEHFVICDRSRRRSPCSVCQARPHEVLCDGPRPPGAGRRRKSTTCDAKLCSGCAIDAGPDRHLCPGHAFGVEEARA